MASHCFTERLKICSVHTYQKHLVTLDLVLSQLSFLSHHRIIEECSSFLMLSLQLEGENETLLTTWRGNVNQDCTI